MDDIAPDPVAVLRRDRQFLVVAARAFEPDDELLTLSGELVDRASSTSVQLDVGEHIDLPAGISLQQALDEHAWRFLNHSCEPNVALRGRSLIALRPIARWDEVTFDYETTEYEMVTPFRCVCASESCTAPEVRGFRHLSEEAREARRERLTPHLLAWWERQRAE